MEVGSTISLTAIATFDQAGIVAVVDVSDSISWSVEDGTGSATITNSGLERGDLTGVSAGTVTVAVTCGAFFVSETVEILSTVDDDDDEGLSFESGTTLTLALGGTGVQLAVSTGSSFDDDNDVTDDVTFESFDTSIATVSATGFLLPVSSGTTAIQATLDGESATLAVTVN